MSIITNITAQKKKGRHNIYLDGSYFCSLDDFTVLSEHLKIGMEVSAEQLNEIQEKNEIEIAFSKCIRLISVRLRSVFELEEYLKSKGYLDKVIKNVIKKLKDYKYLDDIVFSKAYINAHKNYGKNVLMHKLMQKGIKKEDIKLFSAEEEKNNAKTMAKKYVKTHSEDLKTKEKLFRYLISKGFDYEIVKQVLNEIFKSEIEEI